MLTLDICTHEKQVDHLAQLQALNGRVKCIVVSGRAGADYQRRRELFAEIEERIEKLRLIVDEHPDEE